VHSYLQLDNKDNKVHISWDIDAVDADIVVGTGTRARNGLTLRESHFIMQFLARTSQLVGLDMVEVN
jgi:arginase